MSIDCSCADAGRRRSVWSMEDALERLPRAYARFLRLRREGLVDAVVAERLGVPVEALPLLAHLAEVKLTRLREGGEVDGGPLADPPVAGGWKRRGHETKLRR